MAMAAKKKEAPKTAGPEQEAKSAEPGQEVESQVVRVEVISKIFGVTVRRVQQLTQEGIIQTMPARDERGRATRRYDLITTIQKYIQYLDEKAKKKQKTNKEKELAEQKLEAEIALKESQGELHQIRTSIALGKYIPIEEVQLDYAKFFVTFKKFAMSLPVRINGMLSGDIDPVQARKIEKEISSEIAELLNSFVVAGIAKPKDVKRILNGDTQENA